MGIVTEYYLSRAGEKARQGLETLDQAFDYLKDSPVGDAVEASMGFEYVEGDIVEYHGWREALQGEDVEIESRIQRPYMPFDERLYEVKALDRTTPIRVREDELL